MRLDICQFQYHKFFLDQNEVFSVTQTSIYFIQKIILPIMSYNKIAMIETVYA